MRLLTSQLFSVGVWLIIGLPALAQQGWGDIRGQVIWMDPVIPQRGTVGVTKDQQHCLSKGQIISDQLLIDPKTKGVANAIVWIADTNKELPIHPKLKAVPKDTVIIDQPCCMFVPRVTAMREGQKLVIKNPSPVLHNASVMGKINAFNIAIAPGGSIEKTPVWETRPFGLKCDIHGWMGGMVGVFNHPYFALSKADGAFEIKDAPAGNYRVFAFHEMTGWLQTGAKDGQPIAIKSGQTTDGLRFAINGQKLKP